MSASEKEDAKRFLEELKKPSAGDELLERISRGEELDEKIEDASKKSRDSVEVVNVKPLEKGKK